MKKLFFYVTAAATALASCSSEEVVDHDYSNTINFRVAMGPGAYSRGSETTTSNIGQFLVSAIIDGHNSMYFNNVKFTESVKDGTTIYKSEEDEEYYWPDHYYVNFYAYSYYSGRSEGKPDKLDTDKMGTVKINHDAQILTEFSPDTDIARQIDMVTGTGRGNRTSNAAGVSLAFSHILSKIQIKAKSTSKTYTFKIKGARICNVRPTGGTWDIAAQEWTSDAYGSLTNYTIAEFDPVQLLNTGKEQDILTGDNSAMLIPQQLRVRPEDSVGYGKFVGDTDSKTGYTYLSVLLRITHVDGLVYPEKDTDGTEAYGWANVPISTTWEAGKCYTYILDFTHGAGYDDSSEPILGTAIQCKATVTDWVDGFNESEGTITM